MKGSVYAFMSAQHPDPDDIKLPPRFVEYRMTEPRERKYNASEKAVDSKLEFHLKVAARKAKAQGAGASTDMGEVLARMKDEMFRKGSDWAYVVHKGRGV